MSKAKPKPVRTRVIVNRHNVQANRKSGTSDLPVLTAQQGGISRYGFGIEILDPRTGEVLGKFIHSPGKPLSCGATIYFETTCPTRLIGETGESLEHGLCHRGEERGR